MKSWSVKYDKLEQIGEGASGKIYKIFKKQTQETIAAKIINIQSGNNQLSSIEQEIKIMSSCHHDNIVKCYGVELFDGQVWIMMEYCQGGSLADIMRQRKITFTEEEISTIMRQVIDALSYLHEKNIVHRDIKASNLLYNKGLIKIADFGVSIVNQSKMTESKFSRIGSPYWMSPEILSNSIYSQKTDVWALGVTAIELAQGEPPFSHQHPFRAIYSIQTHPPQGLSCPQKWSKYFNGFVKKCLTIDYKDRPTIQKLLQNQFISLPQNYNSMQYSPSVDMNSQETENTLIMHEQIPKSIWEKQSYPHSEQKLAETVVIKDLIEDSQIFQDFFQESKSSIKMKNIIQSKDFRNIEFTDREERQVIVKELYLMMEMQIKDIRKRYMEKIRKLYLTDENKENKAWNSPVKKLKDKNRKIFNEEHERASSNLSTKFY